MVLPPPHTQGSPWQGGNIFVVPKWHSLEKVWLNTLPIHARGGRAYLGLLFTIGATESEKCLKSLNRDLITNVHDTTWKLHLVNNCFISDMKWVAGTLLWTVFFHLECSIYFGLPGPHYSHPALPLVRIDVSHSPETPGGWEGHQTGESCPKRTWLLLCKGTVSCHHFETMFCMLTGQVKCILDLPREQILSIPVAATFTEKILRCLLCLPLL